MLENKIIILGDAMLDINYIATAEKIANEYPIPVHLIRDKNHCLGGAANFALNVSRIVPNIHFIYVSGDDDYNVEMSKILSTNNVDNKCIIDNTRPTTTKNRIFVDKKLVSRFDIEKNHSIGGNIEKQIISHLEEICYETVIISDYSKGVITDGILNYFRECTHKKGIKVFIDPKRKNPHDYRDFYLIKPNLKEFNILNGSNLKYNELDNDLAVYAEKYNNSNIIVTLSEFGVCGLSGSQYLYKSTGVDDVIDVTGAGDTCLAIIVYCYTMKLSLSTTLEMCNYFGEKAVRTVGNYNISKRDILEFQLKKIDKVIHSQFCIRSLMYLLKNLEKKIVFTNGCFDIIHVGHVQYLKAAKELGDILILGINTDSSVSRNKGSNRPYNKLGDRINILSEFSFIDFIIPFDENTPYELLEIIRPDYLVKGADYNPQTIVGREFAKETLVIDYLEGFSSTKYINLLSS